MLSCNMEATGAWKPLVPAPVPPDVLQRRRLTWLQLVMPHLPQPQRAVPAAAPGTHNGVPALSDAIMTVSEYAALPAWHSAAPAALADMTPAPLPAIHVQFPETGSAWRRIHMGDIMRLRSPSSYGCISNLTRTKAKKKRSCLHSPGGSTCRVQAAC